MDAKRKQVKRRTSRKVLPAGPTLHPASSFNTGAMPTRVMRDLKYTQVVTFAALAPNVNTWRLNSTFDPDLTGVGHQPDGRDTSAAFFQSYKVMSVDWKVTFITTSQAPWLCTSSLSLLGGSIATTFNESSEQKGSATGALIAFYPCVMTGSFNLADVFGVSRQQYHDDDLFGATAGANPVNVIDLNCIVYDSTGAAVTGVNGHSIVFEAVYHTLWYGPLVQGLD